MIPDLLSISGEFRSERRRIFDDFEQNPQTLLLFGRQFLIDGGLGNLISNVMGDFLDDFLSRGEHFLTVRTLPPVVFEEFAASWARIGCERVSFFLFSVPKLLLRLLDVIVVENVRVRLFKRVAAFGMTEEHSDRVPVQIVISVEDSRAVVAEVVSVDGLVDVGRLADSSKGLVSRGTCPMVVRVGFPVRWVTDEQPRFGILSLGVVLDPVTDILPSTEHRSLPPALECTFESAVFLVILIVEIDVSFLGVNIADSKRQQRTEALTSEDKQFQQRPVPSRQLTLAARTPQGVDFVLVALETARVPLNLPLLLGSVAIAAAAGFVLVLVVGDWYLRAAGRANYAVLCLGVFALLVAVSYLFAGFVGIGVFLVSCPIGFVPVRFGAKRVHLMGVLMGPIMLWY